MEPTEQTGPMDPSEPLGPDGPTVPRRARRGTPVPAEPDSADGQHDRGSAEGSSPARRARAARRAEEDDAAARSESGEAGGASGPEESDTSSGPGATGTTPESEEDTAGSEEATSESEEVTSGGSRRARTAARAGALRAAGFAALALVVGVGTALVPRQQPDLSGATGVVPGQTLVCSPSQQAADMAVSSTSPALRVAELSGPSREVEVPASVAIGTSGRLVRTANGQGRPAATTISVVGSGASATSSWTSCVTASTGGTVIVADPSVSDIVVTNPESEDASVDVSLSGAKGAISAAGSRGITVPAGSSKVLPLSVWVSGSSPVAATLSTDTGRLVAVARTHGASGAETIAMSSAAQNLWIPAVPAGTSGAELLVSNPTSTRATAKVTALAAGGPFTPEGADQIEIEPNATIAVDVGKALAGEAVGLSLSANVPVSAQLMATKGKDISMATPASAATSLQSALPRGGTVSLSNPGGQSAQVRGTYRNLSGRTISFTATLPTGTTWTKDLGTAGGHLVVTADHAIIGGVWYSGAGLSSVPMSVVSGAVRSPRMSVDPQLS